jgi:hypothetical protein
MLSPALPAQCVPPLPPPPETWGVGIVWAVLLFGEVPALLVFLHGWLWRSLASVPLLAGIWCLLLAFWAQGHPRTFTFLCQQFPGQPPGGLIETSPPIVRGAGTIETVTDLLVLALLFGGFLVVKWHMRLRQSSPKTAS